MRRRRGPALAGLLAGCALALAACTQALAGGATAEPVRPPTAAQAARQALVDLGESGAVRYAGTMRTARKAVSFDLTAARTGEVSGWMAFEEQRAEVLVVDDTIYLNGGAGFWAEVSALGGGASKGAAVADRWVRTPSGVIGLEFGGVFGPDALGAQLARGVDEAGGEPLAEADRRPVGERTAVAVRTGSAVLFLAEEAPHGLVRVEAPRMGRSDATAVTDFAAEVSDASADLAAFYAGVVERAGALSAPVDVLTNVTEGEHNFEACDERSCSIVVRFTNPAKMAVTVSVRGSWTGDGRPLGACDTTAGPVPPGTEGAATCTLSSPEWVSFYRTANSVPGNHPYSVEWSTLVLSDPPDLTAVTKRAQAGAVAVEGGRHVVYALSNRDGVWKYGVADAEAWREQAGRQAVVCLAVTGAMCGAEQVSAAEDEVAGYGLLGELVARFSAERSGCPAGQWTACER